MFIIRWMLSGLNRQTLQHAARTMVAATLSLAIAGVFQLTGPQWAAISTIVVTQSTLGAALMISSERFAGTALGALAAVLLGPHLESSLLVFAIGIFVLGVVCGMFHLDHAAYRFAGITLAIVVLGWKAGPMWRVALHRFIEVSLGILIGLVMTAVWPEREPPAGRGSS